MQYLITVDIGTTSTKTLAFNHKGKIIAESNIAYPIITENLDYSEQDPTLILQAVKKGIYTIVEQVGKEVSGVCFSSAMHSLIVMDEQGVPLTNSIIWADNRSKREAQELKKSEIGFDIYLRTGTPIHPMSPLCKILWLKTHRNDLFNKAHKFISIKEFIFFKLFGQYIVDYSIASATGIFDIYTLAWNKQAINYLGISESQLSQPVPVTHKLAHFYPDLQDDLNLKTDTPFIVGASDGCLANLGANSIDRGSAALTIGTSGAIRIAYGSPIKDEKQRIFNYILDEKNFIIGGPTNNGAIGLEWFKENFSTDTISQKNFFYKLEDNVNSVPPGSDKLLFLPYLQGERAPIWDSNARGVFFGISLTHTRNHFIKAIMEGVIFSLYSVLKPLEEITGNIEVINVGGGFAKSKSWIQMVADIFNKKVVVNSSLQSSSIGASMIGFKALGIYKDYEEMKDFIEILEEYTPNSENHEIYMKYFQIFESLYDTLKEEFKKLIELD